jgi:tetratricopeptide (TPR) repeat protein
MWSGQYGVPSFVSAGHYQDEIASTVADHLPIRFSDEERSRLEKPLTLNSEAHGLMERAGVLFYRASPDSLQRALQYSHQAMNLDPTYVIPYVEIASVYSLYSLTDVMDPREAHAKVVEWTNKASQVNDAWFNSRIAILGEQATYEWDWKEIGQVGSLHPFYRNYLLATGQLPKLLDRDAAGAIADQPHVLSDYYFGQSLYLSRRYDDSIERLKRAIEIDPSFLWPHLFVAYSYTQQGRYDEAISELNTAMALKRALGDVGHVYARAGRRRDALRVLDELRQRAAREYVTPLAFARVYLGLADADRTFEWMRKACESRVPSLIFLKVDPIYDPIRPDPRFAELMKCVGVQ